MDRLTDPTGPRCRCGESVPADVARVFGVDDVVPVCAECLESRAKGDTFDSNYQALQAYQRRQRAGGRDE